MAFSLELEALWNKVNMCKYDRHSDECDPTFVFRSIFRDPWKTIISHCLPIFLNYVKFLERDGNSLCLGGSLDGKL